MKAHLVIAMLLIFPLPHLKGKEHPVLGYSTLVIEYIGKQDRPVFPIIITSSEEEGEWYRKHLFRDVIFRAFIKVNVVPTSTMKDIASIGLLGNGLERPTPLPDQPKYHPVRFVAGAGHRYADTTLDAQTAMTVLKTIQEHVANYPDLRNELSSVGGYLERSLADSPAEKLSK